MSQEAQVIQLLERISRQLNDMERRVKRIEDDVRYIKSSVR